jgi:ABC-type glycerol-3-phosphate transport system substrate-binding protein
MRTHRSSTIRSLAAAVTLLAGVGLAGCGGSGERAADSSSPPETLTRVASVDVTYYYLPG